MASKSFAFPDLHIPDSKKKEEYHENFTRAICFNSVDGAFGKYQAFVDQLYEYYHGVQSGEEYRFLQESENGEALPARWAIHNKIGVKVDLLCGELAEKGYDIKVSAINKEAKIRKLEEKNKLLVQMRLQPAASRLEGQVGLPLSPPGFVPESEEELDDYMSYNYKEKSEIIMESAIKYITRRFNWDFERVACFRDILIAGRTFIKNEVVNGMPRFTRLDPRSVIFDQNAKDDFLSDANYFGEIHWMTSAEVAERYDLTRDQLAESAGQYEEFLSMTNRGLDAGQLSYYGCTDPSVLRWYKSEKGEMRILVVHAVWRDYKDYDHKIDKDRYGKEHIQKVDRGKNTDDYIRRRVQTWRYGTIVGGKFLVAWGETKNQARMNECLHEAKCPYMGLIPNYFNGRSVSKVQQLKQLQDFKDMTMYNVKLAMSRAGAKGFMYDVSQLPEGWKMEDAIQYLKSVGIAFIDSQKDGMVSSFNQFKEFDMTISQSVEQYLNISMMIDREMDAISGINEARQGIVQKSSQAVGVTQSALFQSNLSTATLFKFFNGFTNKFLQHQAELVKTSWANKEEFAFIIGDTGIDFLKQDIDLSLDDYGVFVEEINPILTDIQQFQNLVTAALQAGQIDFLSALKLLQERDIKQGILRFEREVKKMQKQQMEAEQRQMQNEQQMLQQQMQAETQQAQQQAQIDMQKEQASGQIDIQKELIKGRIALMGKKIDLRKDLYKNFKS
jgi:hypothetical protein